MKVEHRIIRTGDTYQLQRKFPNGPSEIWVTKRHKVNNGKPGPFMTIDFFNTIVDHIREEPGGKESIISLSKSTVQHLKKLNFDKATIERMIGHEVPEYGVEK
jgi:hypothetical protein